MRIRVKRKRGAASATRWGSRLRGFALKRFRTRGLRRSLEGGTFWVEWTYENQVERWEGGLLTMDGPTQELFGGEDIPHIWLGSLRSGTTIEVVP